MNDIAEDIFQAMCVAKQNGMRPRSITLGVNKTLDYAMFGHEHWVTYPNGAALKNEFYGLPISFYHPCPGISVWCEE